MASDNSVLSQRPQLHILEPIQRSAIARGADYVGYVPLVGSAVGIIRIITSLVIGILAKLGACIASSQKCAFIATRSSDELLRGLLELIPFCINYVDRMRADQGSPTQPRSTIGGAFGNYMYVLQNDPVLIWYTKKCVEAGKVVIGDQTYPVRAQQTSDKTSSFFIIEGKGSISLTLDTSSQKVTIDQLSIAQSNSEEGVQTHKALIQIALEVCSRVPGAVLQIAIPQKQEEISALWDLGFKTENAELNKEIDDILFYKEDTEAVKAWSQLQQRPQPLVLTPAASTFPQDTWKEIIAKNPILNPTVL